MMQMLDFIKSKWCLLFAWFCVICAAHADLPSPRTLYRLRRVGYEILNDGIVPVEEFPMGGTSTNVFLAVACLVLAMALPLSFETVRKKVCGFVRRFLNWIVRKLEFVVLVLLGVSAAIGVFVVLKREMYAQLCAMGLCHMKYAANPGWRYPDQVPDEVRTVLMNRLNSVKDDLQKAVDSSGLLMEPAPAPYWQVAKPHYARERMSITTKVLSGSEDLRRRCRGIPIEWLVDSLQFHARVVPNHMSHGVDVSEGSEREPQ